MEHLSILMGIKVNYDKNVFKSIFFFKLYLILLFYLIGSTSESQYESAARPTPPWTQWKMKSDWIACIIF